MAEDIEISSIPKQARVHRGTKGEISALAKDIQENGQQSPITICNGVVIDGLKRIAALQQLNVPTVLAVNSDRFDELALNLKGQHPAGTTMQRVLEVFEIVEPLRVAFIRFRRVSLGATKKQLKSPATGISARALMGYCLGISENRVELLVHYGRMAKVDPEIKARLDLVRANRESLYGIQTWLSRRKRNANMPAVAAEEVRTVMERGFRTISLSIEAMSKFGAATVLTLSEREHVNRQLEEMRTGLSRIKARIREGIEDETREKEEDQGGI